MRNQNQCVFVGGVVPVTWLYFNGKNDGTDNILNWATATEQNSNRGLFSPCGTFGGLAGACRLPPWPAVRVAQGCGKQGAAPARD